MLYIIFEINFCVEDPKDPVHEGLFRTYLEGINWVYKYYVGKEKKEWRYKYKNAPLMKDVSKGEGCLQVYDLPASFPMRPDFVDCMHPHLSLCEMKSEEEKEDNRRFHSIA